MTGGGVTIGGAKDPEVTTVLTGGAYDPEEGTAIGTGAKAGAGQQGTGAITGAGQGTAIPGGPMGTTGGAMPTPIGGT